MNMTDLHLDHMMTSLVCLLYCLCMPYLMGLPRNEIIGVSHADGSTLRQWTSYYLIAGQLRYGLVKGLVGSHYLDRPRSLLHQLRHLSRLYTSIVHELQHLIEITLAFYSLKILNEPLFDNIGQLTGEISASGRHLPVADPGGGRGGPGPPHGPNIFSYFDHTLQKFCALRRKCTLNLFILTIKRGPKLKFPPSAPFFRF